MVLDDYPQIPSVIGLRGIASSLVTPGEANGWFSDLVIVFISCVFSPNPIYSTQKTSWKSCQEFMGSVYADGDIKLSLSFPSKTNKAT